MTNIKSQIVDNNTAAVNMLCLLMFIYISRIQELIPYIDQLHIGKITVLLCILFVINSKNKNRYADIKDVLQIKYFKLYLIWMLLSVPFSIWLETSVNYINYQATRIVVPFIIIIVCVKTYSDIIRFVWGICYSALILGVFTFLQPRVERMAVSNTHDSNDLAFVMVVIFPIVYFMMKAEKSLKKLILFVTAAFMLLTIVYTGSRGGFVGLLTVFIAIAYCERADFKRFFIVVLISCAVIVSTASDNFWERMSYVFESKTDYNYKSESGRLEVWKRGLKIMFSNPILGVGAGNYKTADGLAQGSESKKWSVAHNSFLSVGVELGVVGLFIFLKLLYSTFNAFNICRNSNTNHVFPVWLSNGLQVSLIGYASAGFFISQAHSILLYIIIALSIVASTRLNQQVGLNNS